VNGGIKLESGLDANNNMVLDDAEVIIAQTKYICNGNNGSNGRTSLIRTTAEAAGSNCGSGGVKVEMGVDANSNGTLENAEVSTTQYICNGSNGSNGSGLNSLIQTSVESAGANCSNGGVKVETGQDNNNDGILQSAEIIAANTKYICNGTNGTNGSNGTNGTNGKNSLIRKSVENAGANCANGGIKLESGLDANENLVLDNNEVSQTHYVCNGSNGTNGTNGTNGSNGQTSLIRTSAEPAGANCSSGGIKVESGLDANNNNVLDAAEVSVTRYVCNGPQIIYSNWQAITNNSRDTVIMTGTSSVSIKHVSVPAITQSVVDKGAVLVYYRQEVPNTSPTAGMLLPFSTVKEVFGPMGIESVSVVYGHLAVTGKLFVYIRQMQSGGNIDWHDANDRYRYVIIPEGTLGRLSYSLSQLKAMSYEEACKALKIPLK
jgi:small nuclear ribonucleoprotein (snRNP)-like protein